MTIFVLYMACFHGWQYNYNNNSLMNKSTASRGYHNRYNQNYSFIKWLQKLTKKLQIQNNSTICKKIIKMS